jgi:hypothetical protein
MKHRKKAGERVSGTYSEEPRPGRNIPTREQIAHHYSRTGNGSKQHYIPPQQEASRHRVGHYAGFHPEDQPYITGDMQQGVVVADDYEVEEDDAYYQTRLPTSTRRYQQIPDVLPTKGSVNVVEHYHEQPLRAHRHQPPPPRRRYSEEGAHSQPRPRRRFHPLVWIGVFLLFLVSGWTGLNVVTSWYQGVQNDWTYGRQRHFEINAVVGHSDSATNPSHFTAENNNGQIIVIELPGNTVSKAKIYQIETVPGNAGNPPVRLSFQDMNGDGRLDLLVQIGDGAATLYVTLFNNGSEFVSRL